MNQILNPGVWILAIRYRTGRWRLVSNSDKDEAEKLGRAYSGPDTDLILVFHLDELMQTLANEQSGE